MLACGGQRVTECGAVCFQIREKSFLRRETLLVGGQHALDAIELGPPLRNDLIRGRQDARELSGALTAVVE